MRNEQRFSVRAWLDAELRPGRAGKYIHAFDELKPGDRVLLCTCVSWSDRVSNLNDMRKSLSAQARTRGAIVVGVKPYVGSRYDPEWIRAAVAKAKRRGADWLLFESTDRAVRHRLFRSDHRRFVDLQATEEQLRELARYTRDVPVMTHLHPDATPAEVRAYQRRRVSRPRATRAGGQRSGALATRNGAGRMLPVVLELWRDYERSHRQIADETGVPPRTVGRWIARYGHGAPFLAAESA